MKYRITGGADGLSGIEVAGKRYEPGDIADFTASKVEWLVEQGYLELSSKTTTTDETEVTE